MPEGLFLHHRIGGHFLDNIVVKVSGNLFAKWKLFESEEMQAEKRGEIKVIFNAR